MTVFFDSCVVRQMIAQGLLVNRPVHIMHFQRKQLARYLLQGVEFPVTIHPKFKHQCWTKGDLNFLYLDPAQHKVFTFDKKLKKQLQKKAFVVYNNFKSFLKDDYKLLNICIQRIKSND